MQAMPGKLGPETVRLLPTDAHTTYAHTNSVSRDSTVSSLVSLDFFYICFFSFKEGKGSGINE